MENRLKFESNKQNIDLIEWVTKGCPPNDLNEYALGIRQLVVENAVRGLVLKSYLGIIKTLLIGQDNVVVEKTQEALEEANSILQRYDAQ
jgi:hypothetical protein